MTDALTADLLAWCMLLFLPAFALVGPIRRDQGVAQAYLVAVFLHAVAALMYFYAPGVLPPRGDAVGFHKDAIEMQTAVDWPFGFSSLLYKWCLAHLYSWIGPSWLFASMLSLYAFAFSVVVLANLMELLGIQHRKGLAVFFFGALPTAVLYGSVPLREPYQVLFFMIACYLMLRFRLSGNPIHLVLAISSALLMGVLHKGLLIYAPFLIVLMLLVRVDVGVKRGSPTRRVWLHRLMAGSLAAGFIAALPIAASQLEGLQGTNVLSAASSEGLTEFAAQHRSGEHLSQGRTAYGISLDTSSPVSFVTSMTMIFIYYLFMPFPWQVRNFLDIYAFVEVALRAATFFAIFRMWWAKDQVHPHLIKILMLVYLSMAALWAAGTVNYGTATRHHMVHQWIVLMLGVPALVQMVSPAKATPAPANGGHTAAEPSLPARPRPTRLGGSPPLKPRRLAVASIQPRGLKP